MKNEKKPRLLLVFEMLRRAIARGQTKLMGLKGLKTL